MKKKYSLIITFLLCCGLLITCNSNSKVKATFIGVIEEMINDREAFVYVNKTEDSPVYGIIYVNLAKNPDETFQVGDKVKVGYDGTVQGTAPLTVTTLSVELVE
ncbi:hypothetical protein [Lysinibacillus sp. G4S2]|uniref:hypothetical protein n=1 Tax=Lysinibacillus sp. G4S2 TaxID=3055859 RepID=UPI0025A055AF|nr:hypothetical protein [Lysinibacillus sp. G4S2]MDM5249359.1 hypothetical protein [Lysinibacillus sp. G4S2]